MNQLKISETLFITPSPSSSSSLPIVLPLSHLDHHRDLQLNFRTLRLYSSCSSSFDLLCHVIAESLSRALSLYYPLAGTLHLLSNSRLSVCSSSGDVVPLTVATSASSLDFTVNAEPGSEFLDRLAPDLGSSGEAEEMGRARALALQLTGFSCGGFALGMCVNHAMCDGAGATKFLSAVAGFARGDDGVGLRAEPIWERSELLGVRMSPRVEVDFCEFFRLNVAGQEDNCEGNATISRGCFHVSEVGLNRFRDQLKEESGLSFTSFEALGAFIWRARVKASAVDRNKVVKFVYSMNIAKLVKPPLPAGYWGNVCIPVYVKLTARELQEKPIWEIADMIKKSKQNVTDEYVRSYIDFQELHYTEGITAGRWVSSFTDWRHLGHSEVDFGWGSPKVVLPLTWKILGSLEPTFFLPYAAEDERRKDGFKALVCLQENALAAFRLEMERFNCASILKSVTRL